MKEGLYLPNGEFESRDFIRRKLAPPAELEPPPTTSDRSLAEWTKLLVEIQKKREEILPLPSHIKITHKENLPVFYAFIGDIHAGGQFVDYQRINDEVQAIKENPNTFVIAMGDLVDGFFWSPASQEQVANLDEQAIYAQKLMEELRGHLVVAIGGDHCLWAASNGPTIYNDFVNKYQAHYMEGVSYITIKVGESEFRIAAAHRFGGHSIYNKAHSSHRVYRDEAAGADIVVTGHNHSKAINEQSIKEFDGGRKVIYASLGAYKASDKYGRKLGYPKMDYEEMGGIGLTLYPDSHRFDAHWDIREGIEKFKALKAGT
ncbi:MAG: metallophosphoesterase [Chitinophagales bacterium]|nr:metallophosphoesterase [Chitinophagales bacterium]